ncbi:MAG: nucleotidyl transferase AbiEii/AbiGii toxin family protein [Planctomycetes bacterium]|nr:nucleotidyl transferase AbiEii/AbiGii toxin family protein [Planctomycetota bacterium]
MTRLEAVLRRVAADLEREGARWALVGGLAVSARTEPRFTRDLDLAVAVAGNAQAESLVRALLSRGYRIGAALERTDQNLLATVRLLPPGEPAGGVLVDLLFASCGIEPEIVESSPPLEVFPGLDVPVATIPHLLAMKVLARDDVRRPQDAIDISALLTAARSDEIDAARTALETIALRGFDRGKNLLASLDEAADRFRS